MPALINHPPLNPGQQMAWAIAFSLAAHLLLVSLLPRLPAQSPAVAGLRVRIEPIPAAELSRIAPSHRDTAGVRPAVTRSLPMPDRASPSTAAISDAVAASRAESPSPQIDLAAAKAVARAFAREPVPQNPIDKPRTPITLETAIAKATMPDADIETRGAAGEHVVHNRKTRCVTPILVPWYMEGVTMPTQCEVKKG